MSSRPAVRLVASAMIVTLTLPIAKGWAQEVQDVTPIDEYHADEQDAVEIPRLPEPAGAKSLYKEGPYRAWVDPKQVAVLIDGQIALRAGPLEMFACTRNTKEHESVVVVDTQAFPIHAALLALGADQGEPVQFYPTFKPPSGDEIEISVRWQDEEGQWQETRSQDWVRDVHTQQAMTYPWVFPGSSFWTDPETGRKYYQAEAGDFICVSNFATAMIDIPVESTDSNEGLYFEAFTERIPPLGTPVRLVLRPAVKGAKGQKGEEQTAEQHSDQ